MGRGQRADRPLRGQPLWGQPLWGHPLWGHLLWGQAPLAQAEPGFEPEDVDPSAHPLGQILPAGGEQP